MNECRHRLSAVAVGRGPAGADTVTDITITNTSRRPTVAFFLRADVRGGSAAGAPARGDNEARPVLYSDNDMTLWPGESQTLRAHLPPGGAARPSPGRRRVGLERRRA